MRLYLLRKTEINETILPEKVGGRHVVMYRNERGSKSPLLTVDGENGRWIIRGGDKCKLNVEGEDEQSASIIEGVLFPILLQNGEKASLLLLDDDISVSSYRYYRINPGEVVRVSGDKEAQIRLKTDYCGDISFSFTLQNGKYIFNGNYSKKQNTNHFLYVNRRLVQGNATIPVGSVLFICGLKIVFGNGFIAMNNPGFSLSVLLPVFTTKVFTPISDEEKLARSQNNDLIFSSAPRVYRSESHREFVVESPPQPLENNAPPDLVMMGPALTMAAGSLFSSFFSIYNLISTGRSVASAVPSLVISLTMVTGMAVWPTISRRIQRRNQEKKYQLAQEDYHNYLNWLSAEIEKTVDLQKSVSNQNNPTLRTCIEIIAGATPLLWNRSRRHEDFLTATIGKGSLPLNASFKYPERSYSSAISVSAKEMYEIMEHNYIVEDVPITIPFLKAGIVGVIGQRSSVIDFIRALLIELTAFHDYNDLHIAVIYNDTENWEFVKWIPHVWNEERSFRYIARTTKEIKNLSATLKPKLAVNKEREKQKTHYIIIAADKSIAERSDLIKELYENDECSNMTLLTLYNRRNDLPRECRYVIDLNARDGRPSLMNYDNPEEAPLVFNDYVSCPDDPIGLFIRMANIRSETAEQQKRLPTMLTFMEMCNVGRVEGMDVLENWRQSDPVESLGTQIGVDSNGYPIILDVHEKAHGPHGLIAGMTGSGKSEFIISFIASMAVNYSPEDVAFVLIDFKGGGMADVFRDLPHTAGLITNLDGNELKRSFMAIESELQKRQRLFKEISEEKKISNIDIYKYQKLRQTDKSLKPLPHLIIISDEFAELKQQHRDFMEQLIRIARIGRSLGVHLILATQKPDGVVDDQIKSNIHFKVCLKVQDKSDSKAMIGRPEAAEINNAGRFYYQVGNDELFECGQSPWSGAKYEPSDAPKVNINPFVTVIGIQGNEEMRVSLPPRAQVQGVPEKQIDAIVAYLGKLAAQEDIRAEKLWLKPIDAPKVRVEKSPASNTDIVPFVLNPVVGVYDDLENQCHLPLVVPITYGGHTILYGAAGTGALEFINTMLVELMTHHSPEELNLYILDYEAGTLSAFEKAPHTKAFSDSAMGDGEEIIVQLTRELNRRKDVLKEYGGDYQNYTGIGKRDLPNSLLVIHNFQNFLEQSADARLSVAALAREGTQYGVYVFLTGTTGNSVPYAIQPLFHNIYTLQQNNEEQYREILGKTGGIVPQGYRGRGLARINGAVCEFQTKLLFQDADNVYMAVQSFCEKLCEKYGTNQKKAEQVKNYSWSDYQALQAPGDMEKLAVALDVRTGTHLYMSMSNQVASLILYDEEEKNKYYGLMRLLRSSGARIQYYGVDTEMMHLDGWEAVVPPKFDEGISAIWAEIQQRGQAGQEAKRKEQPVPDFEHVFYVFDSVSAVMEWLSETSRQRLVALLAGLSLRYHMHFILIDNAEQIGKLMGPVYLQRALPFAQGVLLSRNSAARLLYSQQTQSVSLEEGESVVITEEEGIRSGLVISATKEER